MKKKSHIIISFIVSFIIFGFNEDIGAFLILVSIVLAVIYHKQNKVSKSLPESKPKSESKPKLESKPKSESKPKPKRPTYPKDFTIIDVETTGLTPFSSEIIEFAAIKVRDLEIVDEFSTLCNPVVPIENSRIHGIKDKDVKNYEYFIGYIPEILEFIGDDTITAYNAPFDIEFVNSYLTSDLKNQIFDVLETARNYDTRDSFKLEKVKKDLEIETKSHRALDDCRTTLAYYEYLVKSNRKLEVDYITCLTTYSRIVPKRNSNYIKWFNENYEVELEENLDPFFYGKNFCFTGVLKRINLPSLCKKIAKNGGKVQANTTLKTDYLIVGDYPDKTTNQKKAEKNNLRLDVFIDILTEDEFLDLIK
jgi:DNA polymerase-3 subunit epsilon